MTLDENHLKVDFYIDTEEEYQSYARWRATLDVGPITTENFHPEMIPIAQKIAKRLDGLGVTLSEVTPVRISKKKDYVQATLKYVEEKDATVS